MPVFNQSEIYVDINSNHGSCGVSVPSYACGKNNHGFSGVVEENACYAIEPFNTNGEQGLIENIGSPNSSNIYRITGSVSWRKALTKTASPWEHNLPVILRKDIQHCLSLSVGHSRCWRSHFQRRMKKVGNQMECTGKETDQCEIFRNLSRIEMRR